MKIGIIGLGLLGGSMALAIKKTRQAKIFGKDLYHQDKAAKLGLFDEVLNDELIPEMDIIILATPVDTLPSLAYEVLNQIHQNTLVFDVGSTKNQLAQTIDTHPNRKNFLLVHPIAGTEYSGPEAAFSNLFANKINIVCDIEKTDKEILQKGLDLFEDLQMKTIQMNSREHDRHIAYVSHLSHISSFMLGKTVMDLEKDEKNIYQMAGSGFASTVRLAKSSPATWTPIFLENKEPILQSLTEYIENLNFFVELLKQSEEKEIKNLLKKINHIGKIIDKINDN